MQDQETPAVESENGSQLARRMPEPVALPPVMSDDEIARTWRIAKALHASGIYKDLGQAEQAFAKILVGRDLGLSPAQAMSAIQFVEGNVQLHYRALGAFVRRNGYDFRIREHTDEVCDLEFLDRDGTSLGHSRFSMDDAKRAGLGKPTRSGAPSNYAKYPRNMLIARAMSNGVGWYCPEVLSGIPVYVEGEIEPAVQIASGTGDGQPQGIELGPDVEAVLLRASELHHAGLADRATAEMALAGQPPEFVSQWVQSATVELDRIAGEPPEAEVVEDDPDRVQRDAVRATAKARVQQLREQAEDAHQEGDDATAQQLVMEAQDLEAQIVEES